MMLEFYLLSTMVDGKRKYVAINNKNGKIKFIDFQESAIRFDDKKQAKDFGLKQVKKLCMITREVVI